MGCFGGRDEDTEKCTYIKKLQCELANSYYWSGNCCADYFFFVCNWHPLVGMFFCHPNHPWSKRERLTMTLISLSVTMVPSAMIGTTFAADAAAKKLFTILGVTIPDAVIGVILYQLSIADSRYGCHMCAPLWSCLRSCLMCMALVGGVVSTAACYTILHADGVTHWDKMFGPLATGIAVSYLTWFPLWLIIPCQLGFISNWSAENTTGQSKAKDLEDQAGQGAE